MKNIQVAVGLSGGVDSAVAAGLLKEQGFEVTGVYLECWNEPGCKTEEDRKDALDVALKLEIPFKVLDFRSEYKVKVVDYFYSEYKKGLTPNPDVMCNQEIKFGMFYKWMVKNNFDYLATGHYARVEKNQLLQGVDEKKDQSYFLYRLKQDQLKHILFPIGEMTKTQVRRKARSLDLKVADKPDSQGICFIGKVDVREFLKKKLGEKKGEVMDRRGRVIGDHQGVWFYTVGQRHGFKIKVGGEKRKPLYVIEKDAKNNKLIVGEEKEVYRDKFIVKNINLISKFSIHNLQFSKQQVRIRHGGELLGCKVDLQGSSLKVKLKKPVKGVAAGQSAVFYKGEVCLGGGVIF